MRTLMPKKNVVDIRIPSILIAILLCVAANGAPSTTQAPVGRTVHASVAGAKLDSNLMKGGGTDDTAVLQKILNEAENGSPIRLIIDGPTLVSGLNVYGSTTLECIEGGGLYLKTGSNRAIIRNVHRSRDATLDEHITIRGCFLHGNKDGQTGAPGHASPNQEVDGSYFAGLQFFGVNYLTIENVTLWNVRAFATHVANASRIDVRNVIVDNGVPLDIHGSNMDGFHFNGPIRYLTIDGMKLRTFDDGFTLGANDAGADDLRIKNDMGPYVGQGPITDVTVNNLQFMDSFFGIRLMSSTDRLDRVVINNVTGTVQAKLAIVSHFVNPGLGNFGSISFSNVAVDPIRPSQDIWQEKSMQEQCKDPTCVLEYGGHGGSLFVLNGHIENLNLRNVVTRAIDRRPVIWVGHDSLIRMLNADLSIYDPARKSTPIRQEKDSRIERLNLNLQTGLADEQEPISE